MQLKQSKEFSSDFVEEKALFMAEGKSKQENSHSWPLGNVHEGEESFSI